MIISQTEVLDAIRAAMQQSQDTDGFTTTELARAMGCGAIKARETIRGMVREGRVIPTKLRRTSELSGITSPVPGYRLQKKGK